MSHNIYISANRHDILLIGYNSNDKTHSDGVRFREIIIISIKLWLSTWMKSRVGALLLHNRFE